MLTRFLDWYFSSQIRPVVWVREFVRRHRILQLTARALYRAVRTFPPRLHHFRKWMSPSVDTKLSAILTARSVGGAVTVSELEDIWRAGKPSRHALCLGAAPELEQIDIILRAVRTDTIVLCPSLADAEREASELSRFDLIVASPTAETSELVDRLSRASKSPQVFLKVAGSAARCSNHYGSLIKKANPESRTGASTKSLYEKLVAGDRLRIVMLNDVGFQYGAGIALMRQAASFLLNGWDVSVVAWTPGPDVEQPSITGLKNLDSWRGAHSLQGVHANNGLGNEQIIAEVESKIHSLNPDIVVTGNLHGAGWPIGILPRLQQRGTMVVAYMHDTYWVTGRCAQPLSCTLFRTGCDARCPTPHENPRLAPEKIAGAWQDRAKVFTGPAAIPLIANSNWTRDIALQRYGGAARTDVVHLGLDHNLFAPISKSAARRLLRLPQDKTIVVMGAVDVQDRWKGGPLFKGIHETLLKRSDVALILFGRSSELLQSAKSFGMVRDERLMPLILNAADIFVSTGIAESFGQTLLEASACALPVVALDVGGVKDVVVHEQTGLLVKEQSVDGLLAAIDLLISDPATRERLGQNGRLRVEQRFTLASQAKAWTDCLKKLSLHP